MSLTKYEGPAEIQIDGRTLIEAIRISVQVTGGNNPVMTMKKGVAGRSKGPTQSNITVEQGVPVAGLEFEAIEKVIDGADAVIVHLYAGKRYRYNVWIDSVDVSSSVDGPATLSFTAIGGGPDIV